MKQNELEYLKYLSEQIYFLRQSCDSFDKGVAIEAKRMAVAIRILVHDTKNSVSLLTHLNSKLKLYYFNTAIPDTQFGLTGIRTTTEGGGKTEFYAPLDKLSEKRREKPWVTFKLWWEDMKVLSDGKNRFSRKDLVLTIANQDGGAHVDSNLKEPYSQLTRENSLNVFHHESNVFGVELASLRQITFELLKSLEDKFSSLD